MADRVIGDYQVIEKIGSGGMGEVYRALDTRLSREVALKILPEDVSQDAEALSRFEREAKAVAALSHPNILAIHEFGTSEGVSFAATELLEGQTLRERLREGAIPLRKAIDMASQIADGLSAAHSNGIVHRDLKPENVFVTRDGRIKILDFGLARVEPLQHSSQTATLQVDTAPGTIMGTMGYMSPEQVRGERVDARSDIFSFGALLHEMLSGDRAFSGNTGADILGSILRDDPPSISASNPALPEGVGRIVQHCMEKNPEERFQSARDLGFALKAASSPSHASLSAIDVAPARQRRSLAWIPVVAILGWVLAGWLWLRGDAPSSNTATDEPVSTQPWTFSGQDRTPAASPDGERVAFVSDRNGTAQVWIKQVQGGGERRITDGPDRLPRFSPDGSQLLFIRRHGANRDLYRIPVDGGNPRKVLDDVNDADWSPSGEEIAFCRTIPIKGVPVTEIRILNERSGSERLLTSIEDRFAYGVRWSRDGSTIAITESHISGNAVNSKVLRLIDVASGESRTLIPRGQSSAFTATEWLADGTLLVAQHASLLSNVGSPLSRVLRLDLEHDTETTLFWAFTNVPLGGTSFSTLAPIGKRRLVFDGYKTQQNLMWFDLDGPEAPKPLTRGLARDRQPHFSPDNTRLLFSSERSGNLDLWVKDLRTQELLQFTDDEADDWDPAFTPDGKSILWSSNRSGNLEIWMMNADGSSARQVTNNGVNAENPTATSDGQWIAFSNTHPEQAGIYRVRPDGSDLKRLVEGTVVTPDVSPVGSWCLFVRSQSKSNRIFALNIETEEVFEVAHIAAGEREVANVLLGRERWWPDGSSFIFIGADDDGRTGVFRQDFIPGVNTEHTKRRVAGFSGDYAIESLAVAPDGKSLVLSVLYETHSLQMADGVHFAP